MYSNTSLERKDVIFVIQCSARYCRNIWYLFIYLFI